MRIEPKNKNNRAYSVYQYMPCQHAFSIKAIIKRKKKKQSD